MGSWKPVRNLPGKCLTPPLWFFSSLADKKAKSVVFPTLNLSHEVLEIPLIWSICQNPAIVVSQWSPGGFPAVLWPLHYRCTTQHVLINNFSQIFCCNCKGVNKTRIRLGKYFGYIVSSSLCKCKLNRTQNRIGAHRRILPVGP